MLYNEEVPKTLETPGVEALSRSTINGVEVNRIPTTQHVSFARG